MVIDIRKETWILTEMKRAGSGRGIGERAGLVTGLVEHEKVTVGKQQALRLIEENEETTVDQQLYSEIKAREQTVTKYYG